MTLSYRQRKEKDTIPNTIKYTWQKRRAHHAKPSHAAHTHTTHMRSIMELEMERPGNLKSDRELRGDLLYSESIVERLIRVRVRVSF